MDASDLHSWHFTRIEEISKYATEHDMSVREAIVDLVNNALSGTYRQGYAAGYDQGYSHGRKDTLSR